MEGVGARLGRSSTRYGPATVFTGPVRKWKKKWVHVTPPSSNNNHHHHHQTAANGTANGSDGSHLLLYKWTPITASQNKENGNIADGNGEKNDDDKDDGSLVEEPPKRKFKYIPVAVLEEQKNEVAEQVEDEAKSIETDTTTTEPNSKSDGFDEKPDINDTPMEESQDAENNQVQRQDLNESTLDLSLGLKAHDGDNNSDSKTDQS